MRVSSKRQITLPVEFCQAAQIDKGDEVECFVDHKGIISVVKKVKGAAYGLLKDVKADPSISDEESMQSAISS